MHHRWLVYRCTSQSSPSDCKVHHAPWPARSTVDSALKRKRKWQGAPCSLTSKEHCRWRPQKKEKAAEKKWPLRLMQDSNGGHGTKIDRTSVYYICATAFMLKIFSAIKLKMLERWIWHFHIFSHFKKYFLKIFSTNWYQTYFYSHFLFFMKMKTENMQTKQHLNLAIWCFIQ